MPQYFSHISLSISIELSLSLITCKASLFSNINIKTAGASNEKLQDELNVNLERVLNDTDLSSLDESVYSIPNMNLSFKDFVKDILNDKYSFSYNDLFLSVKTHSSINLKVICAFSFHCF